MDKLINIYKKNYLFRSFFISLFIAICFFIPFIILNKGYFLYYGDFNVQEIPFYKMAHEAVRSGNIFWNIYTDLGANFVGTYSFYMLGSPFFWITLLFPNECVPYLMGPLLILKFSVASVFACMYLKRYVSNEKIIVLGSILYAFSGFSIYNIFFNHFHEAIAIFPLLLYSLDELMYDNKRFLFCIVVFSASIMNYYFFVGQAVFIIIYIFIKILTKEYKIDKFKIFTLLLEFILGILLSAFLLIPALLSAIQNPRTENMPLGFDALLYSPSQRYLHIIESFFFLPDLPAMPNFTPNSDARWSSIAAWIPLFALSGVFSYFKLKKNSWLKALIIILFCMSLVPLLNSIFQAFNQAFYVRWFYMLILLLVLATCISLEKFNLNNWNKSLILSLIITLCIAIPIGLMPQKSNDGSLKIGLMAYQDRFFIYLAISLFCILILAYIFNFCKEKIIYKINLISIVTSFIIIITSMFLIVIGKSMSYNNQDFIITYCLKGRNIINLPDIKNCRSDVYKGMSNLLMFWKMPGIQSFNTIVPGSIMNFYSSIGVERTVRSNPLESFYGVRALTSCRWLLDYKGDSHNFSNNMPGFRYYDTQNNFDIFENEYYIPYGFTYDKYITESQYEKVPKDKRHLVLLKALILKEDQEKEYSGLLQKVDNIGDFHFDKEEYFSDCLNRRKLCCRNFNYDNRGFSAEIDLSNENGKLVFFSVPFEKGFTATVNNIDTKIEKVNVGFMAVKVPGHTKSTIRFNYMTPGLKEGLIISGISIILLLKYIAYFNIKRKKDAL